MGLSPQLRVEIYELLTAEVRKKLAKTTRETTAMPFHTRLFGTGRMATFSFIQSANTGLGKVFERIAAKIAYAHPRFRLVVREYDGLGKSISTVAQSVIQAILDDLGGKGVGQSAEPKKQANKREEAATILSVARKGGMVPITSPLVDLFTEDQNGTEYCIAMTTAKPNAGEFKAHKRTLLEWIAIRGATKPTVRIQTMVAIPYNPYEGSPYNRWTMQRWFDADNELLVGRHFWDFLGGDGTYEELLEIFERVGRELNEDIQPAIERM
ncbi:MAG: TdeIII family type II restriction endonuclease [Chloroflexi bacterium]|nr:TdeIII family type II restriction endonuclease [Chloroflexota bacterium]